MLIEICDDIVVLAEQNNLAVITALERISIAYKYGKHLVYAKFPLLNKLCKLKYLNKQVRDVYSNIKKQASTQYVLVQKIDSRILLTTHKGCVRAGCLHINPCDLAEFEWFEETHLLVENLTDSKFYGYLVEYYKRSKLIKCSTCFYPLQGGGDTIKQVYKFEIDIKQHLCLSIVDSDKKYPNGKIGQTASELKKWHNKNKPINGNIYIMQHVREVENLIPLNVLQYYVGHTGHQIFSENLLLDFSYFDMKEGLLRCKTDTNLFNYWSQQFTNYSQLKTALQVCKLCAEYSKPSPKPADCLSVCNTRCIIDGFGAKTLENLLKNNNSDNWFSNIGDTDLTQSQKSEWTAIGKIIFEWSCSAPKLRA